MIHSCSVVAIQTLTAPRKAATGHVSSHPQSPERKAAEQVVPCILNNIATVQGVNSEHITPFCIPSPLSGDHLPRHEPRPFQRLPGRECLEGEKHKTLAFTATFPMETARSRQAVNSVSEEGKKNPQSTIQQWDSGGSTILYPALYEQKGEKETMSPIATAPLPTHAKAYRQVLRTTLLKP